MADYFPIAANKFPGPSSVKGTLGLIEFKAPATDDELRPDKEPPAVTE